jgi:catechol 2,3-dioxygenase-like lactoylglutathione lyase family enzyme
MSEAPKLNALIPELYCTSVKTSVAFYTEILGFKILYQREEATFAMLERQGAQSCLTSTSLGARVRGSLGHLRLPSGAA